MDTFPKCNAEGLSSSRGVLPVCRAALLLVVSLQAMAGSQTSQAITPGEPPEAPASGPASAPADATTRQFTLACTADTLLLTTARRGDTANCGGLRELQLQGNQAWALFRFDLAPVRDMRVRRAVLRVHRRKFHLLRVSVSTVASTAEWAEGDSREPHELPGAVCFRDAAYNPHSSHVLPWGRPGSTLAHVTFGYGGSRWAYPAIRFEADLDWFALELPADLVQAMVDGEQADSLVLTDDFNRTESYCSIDSRETLFPPTLIVEAEAVRSAPISAPPTNVRTERDEWGFDWLTFDAPAAFAFDVILSDREPGSSSARSARVPRIGLPSPGVERHRVLLSSDRREEHTLAAVRVREAGGTWSTFVSAALPPVVRVNPELTIPSLPRFDLPADPKRSFALDAAPVISEDGRWIRSAAKTWWDPFRGPISLQAGWNEHVSVQVVLAGDPGEYSVLLTDWSSPAAIEPAPRVTFFGEHFVQSRLGENKFCPDPLVPLEPGARLRLDLTRTTAPSAQQDADLDEAALDAASPASAPATTSRPVAAAASRRKRVQPIWIDIYVPRGVVRGVWRARVVAMRDGVADLDIPLELEVTRGVLPDECSFPLVLRTRPSAWAATSNEDQTERSDLDFHRLAHAHRTVFESIAYAPDGRVAPGKSPRIDLSQDELSLDWAAWDAQFAPLLDGAAFRDLPRDGKPVERLVMPIHENWPARFRAVHATDRTPVEKRYHYAPIRTELVRGVRPPPRGAETLIWPPPQNLYRDYHRALNMAIPAIASHLANWPDTRFDVWFMNGPGRPELGGGWWLEMPQAHDDVLALAFFLGALEQAWSPAARQALRRHAVLDNPLITRDLLAGRVDIVTVGAGLLPHQEAMLEHPDRFPEVWWALVSDPEYGAARILADGWTYRIAGARGALVQECVADPRHWNKAANASWLYPPHAQPEPPWITTQPGASDSRAAMPACASMRLKMARRLQEDMEWLAQVIQRERARGVPEGYVLSWLGIQLSQKHARLVAAGRLLPVVEFPGRLDTVAFEELRRAIRAAAAAE